MKLSRIYKKKFVFFSTISALFFLILVFFCAIFAEQLAPYSALEGDITLQLCRPSREHWLGCDLYGIDVLSQLIVGSRTSLVISLSVVAITTIIGCTLGSLAAFFGGFIDRMVLQLTESFMAFPGILLLMCLGSLMEMTLFTLIIALSITGWVGTARLVRAELLKCREYDYVVSAKAVGLSPFRIMLWYLLPNIYSPVLVTSIFGISGVILTEATLSFLGLGPQESSSWGLLINQGRSVLQEAPRLSFFPGACIFFLILSLNILGDRIQELTVQSEI